MCASAVADFSTSLRAFPEKLFGCGMLLVELDLKSQEKFISKTSPTRGKPRHVYLLALELKPLEVELLKEPRSAAIEGLDVAFCLD
jgi:hypothetical protein